MLHDPILFGRLIFFKKKNTLQGGEEGEMDRYVQNT